MALLRRNYHILEDARAEQIAPQTINYIYFHGFIFGIRLRIPDDPNSFGFVFIGMGRPKSLPVVRCAQHYDDNVFSKLTFIFRFPLPVGFYKRFIRGTSSNFLHNEASSYFQTRLFSIVPLLNFICLFTF